MATYSAWVVPGVEFATVLFASYGYLGDMLTNLTTAAGVGGLVGYGVCTYLNSNSVDIFTLAKTILFPAVAAYVITTYTGAGPMATAAVCALAASTGYYGTPMFWGVGPVMGH